MQSTRRRSTSCQLGRAAAASEARRRASRRRARSRARRCTRADADASRWLLIIWNICDRCVGNARATRLSLAFRAFDDDASNCSVIRPYNFCVMLRRRVRRCAIRVTMTRDLCDLRRHWLEDDHDRWCLASGQVRVLAAAAVAVPAQERPHSSPLRALRAE